ncbi:P-loop containing nucleoside triphosphate hydrolase protein [Mycena floridula]|nr:P-loop containing nucleoside triphosphate hydrolase protein [Mycena floridula]
MVHVPTPAYNAKGRQSNGGSRKKGKPKKKSKSVAEPEPDVNSLIHVPKTQEEKEQDRKEKLKQELIAQAESKWTSKKKKRLEKYIDKKLLKEERVAILKKLSESQAQLPSSVNLHSSSMLGSGKTLSHRELQEKSEDKEVRNALDGKNRKRKRRGDQFVVSEAFDEDESEEDEEEAVDVEIVDLTDQPRATPAVGSALRNPLDSARSEPKAKNQKTAFPSWKMHQAPEPEVESDSSFDSSDSENDSAAEEDDDEGDEDEAPQKPKKSLGFKDWAVKQLEIAKGYEKRTEIALEPPPTEDLPPPTKKQKVAHPPGPMIGPTGEEFKLPSTSFAEQLTKGGGPGSQSVTVTRPPDVDESRLLLPIISEEQPIMEAILLHPIIVICGETGSGKTTQVPQFLYEAGFGTPGSDNPGMIGITQPRRVAAVSMAARVAHELSLTSSHVSYQIRYDATVSPNTSIKFMTDGVLLRELATDFLLTKYSVIIIDEAHERSMNTDILIGVLSRVTKLREEMWKEGKEGAKPLRLIIMSATLRVADFAENRTLFSTPPPVINVAARQYPVTVHFSRRTSSDYVTEAIKKTAKIHTRLPPGGILIFLTGQNEITGVCRKLEAKFGAKAQQQRQNDPAALTVGAAHADVEVEDIELGNDQELAFDVDASMEEEDPEALDTDDEDDALEEALGIDLAASDAPMHIVPLYSMLPSEKQMLVFKPPPDGSRLVVVATNVAETSLTIPGIRYVVDCGRAKERRYDLANGIQSFQVGWISKASASQRAGRAGRTGPGHCYRLYSSALYEHHFSKFTEPELLRVPIEGVVLQMKSMHIDTVVNFPFPTPPDRTTLQKAEKTLNHLGALAGNSTITELGRMMSLFPLSPRFSRMLVSGQQKKCLPYVIIAVSALSVGDPFLHDETLSTEEDLDEVELDAEQAHLTSSALRAKEALRLRRKAFYQSQHLHASLGNSLSDVFKSLSVVGAYGYATDQHKFCNEHFVRMKAMEEIHKLRAQISNIVQANFPGVEAGFEPRLPPPDDIQLKVIRQLLTAAFIDQTAVRKDRVDRSSSGTQYSTCRGVPYRAIGIEEDVYIHPSSVLANGPPPEYVVFYEVVRTSQVWLKGLTVVNPAWLSSLGKGSLCTYSKPVKNSAGVLMVTPRFGPDAWELPAIKADV